VEENAVVNRHNSQADKEDVQSFTKAGTFLAPVSGAQRNHQQRDQRRGYGKETNGNVGRSRVSKLHESLDSHAQDKRDICQAQPHGGSQHGNHVGPVALTVVQQYQNGRVQNQLIEMNDDEARFQLREQEETEDLCSSENGDITIGFTSPPVPYP
jgi:hypothetical protein